MPTRHKTLLVIDMVESVRIMANNEAGTIERWQAFVARAKTGTLPRYNGRLVKSLGDGLLVDFDDALQAVKAALELHETAATLNDIYCQQEPLRLRAGLNSAQIYSDDLDIYGSGVNLTARVAALAAPGETVVTSAVRDCLTDGVDAEIEDLGDCYLKHVSEPVRVWRVGSLRQTLHARQLKIPSGVIETNAPKQPTTAIIPFTSRSNAPEHFAVGELIADGVIAQLSRTAELKVISRLSASTLRGRQITAESAKALLGVHYLLSGAYVERDGRLLVTFELTETGRNEVVFSDRISGDLNDLFQIESELCHTISSAAHTAILDREVQKSLAQPLPNIESYSLLLAGITGVHRTTAAGFDAGQRVLNEVVERHPRHARSLAWLAKWYAIRVNRGLSAQPQLDSAHAATLVRTAIEVGENDAFTLAICGLVKAFFLRDWDAADALYKRSIALNPSESLAWLFTGTLRALQGRGAEAAIAAENALALSPIDPMRYYTESLAGTALLAARNFPSAEALFRGSLRANYSHASSHRGLVLTLALSGQTAAAITAASQLLVIEPNFSVAAFLRRYPASDMPHATDYAQAFAAAGLPRT